MNFVYPEELHYFIKSIRPFDLKDVGSTKWFEIHAIIIKVSQQAILEATEFREEEVRECLIVEDKLKDLIHETYCVLLWKTSFLPHLLEINPNPTATFLIYTVLFHEGVVISLLDTLFHERGCRALQESAIDLIDYCVQAVAQVIGLVSMGYHENKIEVDVDKKALADLERQKRNLNFKIGMRCISLLSYLADKAYALPIGATRRMIITHDLPCLMVDLLHFHPWQRKGKMGLQKFVNDIWTTVKPGSENDVTKPEVQTWFCLRQLFFNKSLMECYQLTEQRRIHISKSLAVLYDTIIDQLPPSMDLKQFLIHLSISSYPNTAFKSNKSNLLLEEVPKLQNDLIKKADHDGGYLVIAQNQESIFLTNDKHTITRLAAKLNSVYNTDSITEFQERISVEKQSTASNKNQSFTSPGSGNKCCNCFDDTETECGKCKNVYYCSRTCQTEDWSKHDEGGTRNDRDGLVLRSNESL